MLKIITMESKTPTEWARRIEAWASTEAKQPADRELASTLIGMRPMFVKHHNETLGSLLKAIRVARSARIKARGVLFTKLIQEAK